MDLFAKIFISILLLIAIFEVGLLIYAVANADSVTCNLLWCKVTVVKERITRDCYLNGVPINCSEVPEQGAFDVLHMCKEHGICDYYD